MIGSIPNRIFNRPQRNTNIFLIISYLFINALFLYKYGSRQDYIDPVLLTILFLMLDAACIFIFLQKEFSNRFYKLGFFILAVGYIIFTICANHIVDKYALNVDRWSAMEACVKAFLKGDYPYAALDHMGGRSSNLPTLIFLGIPFYLLGDVGYLQTFFAAVFFIFTWYKFDSYKARFIAVFLFATAISFGWEVWVKSDVMSNFILLLIYVVATQSDFDKGKKLNIFPTALISSLLILTRLVVIIPITLLLFKKFTGLSFVKKILFLFIALLVMTLSFWLVFRNISSKEQFLSYNPFELQNSQLPLIFSIICVCLSVIYACKVQNLDAVLKYSTYLLLLPAIIAMLFKMYQFGIHNAFFNSKTDLSYWDMGMPFLIFYIANRAKNKG